MKFNIVRGGKTTTLHAVTGPVWEIWDRIQTATLDSPDLAAIQRRIDDRDPEDYEWAEGLLLFHGKVMVPDVDNLQTEIISHFHESHMGGHSGIYRTWVRIAATFFWPGLKMEASENIRELM